MCSASVQNGDKLDQKEDRAIVQDPAAQLDAVSDSYGALFSELKQRIRGARVKAALSVNRELVILYWDIGRRILRAQEQEGWGSKIIDQLSADLRQAFPEARGFSVRNLKYMRSFGEAYPEAPFVQQVAAQIPWFHNCTLLDKVKDPVQREWYIRATIEHGWSRAVLVHQIESDLYGRQGQALTNFERALPAPQSDLARELIKDPYNLDFLGFSDPISERALEQSILEHLKDFLIELGKGFAFMGSQYHLEIGGQDYYLDLLFYNTLLRAYVVIDLKVEAFKPEFAGKMNFYLNVVDELLRQPDDQPPIGLILCKERNHVTVEFSLRGMEQPIDVSEYQLLPKEVRDALPTPEQLEAELEKADKEVNG